MKKRFYIIGLLIIIIDQLTKFLLKDKYLTVIPKVLNFTYTENTGGAFGVGSRFFILGISIVIVAILIYFMVKEKDKIIDYTPYILIISGSFGNMIDRIFRGYVIDFIDIRLFDYPNFNIADICVVCGVFLLIIEILFFSKKKEIKK